MKPRTIEQWLLTFHKAEADCAGVVLSMPARTLIAAFEELERAGVSTLPHYAPDDWALFNGHRVRIQARDVAGDGTGAYIYEIGPGKWKFEHELEPIKNGRGRHHGA